MPNTSEEVLANMFWLISFVLSESFWPYLLLILLCYIYANYASSNSLKCGAKQNVLFVTAHPDDECMFFAPTIKSMLRAGNPVYLVCLSKGDYEGLGDVRKKELIASCSKLGIYPSRVTIVDDEKFRDGPENNWSVSELAERILGVIKRVNANAVVTFDGSGVSGHPNHIALYKAIYNLWKTKQLDEVSVFTLETTNLVRKYISVLDIPLSSISNMYTFVSLPREIMQSWQAMAAHESQLVWFRKLYMIFSRYMYVNTLNEIK